MYEIELYYILKGIISSYELSDDSKEKLYSFVDKLFDFYMTSKSKENTKNRPQLPNGPKPKVFKESIFFK